MKRFTNLLLFFLVALTGYAQENPAVSYNEIVIGRDYIADEDIFALEYDLPERIEHITIDPDSLLMVVQLRGLDKKSRPNKKGSLVMYDLAGKETKWTKQVNYNNEEYSYLSHNLLKFSRSGTALINKNNGEEKWKIGAFLQYVHPSGVVGIGVRDNSNNPEAFNLRTGKSLWKRKVNSSYGWNLMNLSDTTLLVYGSGLYGLNIFTGKGWDYKATTHEKDYTASIIGSVLGIGLGVLTGHFMVFTGASITHGISSNVLIENEERIYYAGREKLVCIDFQGNVIWEAALSKDKTSRSSLFIDREFIYMVNYGCAILNGQMKECGIPFIASYNKHDGTWNYTTTLDEKTLVNDYFSDPANNTLYILSDKAIALYNMDDGAFIIKRHFATEDHIPALASFLSEGIYTKSDDGLYHPMPAISSGNIHVITYDNEIYGIDANLNVLGKIDEEQLFHLYYGNDNYHFLGNSTRTVVIDDFGLPIGRLNVSAESHVAGNKLYETKENRLTEVDISRFVR